VIIGHTIDERGYWTGDVLKGSLIDPDIHERCPDGFYKPRWDGIKWVEGLTQEEIDQLNNVPAPETDTQKIVRLESQIDELTLMFGDLVLGGG
jgi:hypothetical protein